jgi:hypothetical protein
MFYKCSIPNRSKRLARDCGCNLTSSIVINGLFAGPLPAEGGAACARVPVTITNGHIEITLT